MMKKQVILQPKDIYPELLDHHESSRIQYKFDRQVMKLMDTTLSDELYNDKVFELLQQKYRDILAITRPRIDNYDVQGNRILTPEEYLDRLDSMDEQQQTRFKSTITAPVTFKRNGEPHVVQVDYHLAPFLQRLADAGYRTGQSDSGTLTDHPNYRYVKDSEQGLFVEGECIYYNKQGSGAYLTFWKPEAEDVRNIGDIVNTSEQIDDIRRIATGQGWIVEDTEIFFQPSVRLGLPFTYDGSSKKEILDEASTRTDEAYPDLKEKDFLQWLKKRTPIEHQVWKEHGGVVNYTDRMILERWEKLTRALEFIYKQRQVVTEEKERQEQLFARITDVTIFTGGDGYWRIKCKIDGKQQISERMADHEMKALNHGTSAKVFAAQKYEDVLNAPQEELSKSLKR